MSSTTSVEIEGHSQTRAGRARPGAVRHGLHGAVHGVHHLRHRHPVDRRPTVGRLPGDARGDGVHRQVLRPDVGGVSGGRVDLRLHPADVRCTDRFPGRLVAAARLPVPADAELPGHRHLHGGGDPVRARLGVDSGLDRRGDGAQRRRHRLGGTGQLPAARTAGGLHRRLRGDGLHDHHQDGQRQPDGAVHG